MYIEKVVLNNFRIYNGWNELDLSGKRNTSENIVIVSGQNGYGKTTFLMSLVWCLYGKNMAQVDEIYSKEISEKGTYEKYVSGCMNRKAHRDGETEFFVEIHFSDVLVEGVPCDVVVRRSYNTVSGRSDRLKISISGQPQELIEDLSSDNQRGEEIFIRDFILPIAIAKFFFFDAEKITALAEISEREQRRSLSLAYSEVLGIHKYESLKDTLEDQLDEYRKNSATQEEQKKFNSLDAEIKNTGLNISGLERALLDVKEEKDKKRLEAEEISSKLLRAGDRMTAEEVGELNKNRSILEKEKSELQESLKGFFNFIPFALAGETLASTVEQVKKERLLSEAKYKEDDVEEKITKIRQDIENAKNKEVITFDVRVCDFFNRQIDVLIRKYFCVNTAGVDTTLRVLHDFSENQTTNIDRLVFSLTNDFKQKFERLNSDYLNAKRKLDTINRRIRDAEKNAQDKYIVELREKKSTLDSDVSKCDQKIGELSAKIDVDRENLKKLKQEQTILRKRLDESSQYSSREEKVRELIRVLEAFILDFKKLKKKSLQEKMLSSLKSLLHKKDFIHRVDVDILTSEDIDIVLYGADGKQIDKSGLSMGERQLYASALLSSLVSESEIDFPVFIDSPMQKFDKHHAENIIKYFYPNVAKQVVISPLLEKELNEAEYEILRKNVLKTFLIKNTSPDSSKFLPVDSGELFTVYNKVNDAN